MTAEELKAMSDTEFLELFELVEKERIVRKQTLEGRAYRFKTGAEKARDYEESLRPLRNIKGWS